MIFSRRELLQASFRRGARRRRTGVGSGHAHASHPHSGEELPVIGMGTWRTFDTSERAALVQVVRTLFEAGGRVIDSSPMYGRSETTVGEVLEDLGETKRAFLASKVWTTGREEGIAQMRESIRRMGRVDLMQIHNLIDWRTHLATLRSWKDTERSGTGASPTTRSPRSRR